MRRLLTLVLLVVTPLARSAPPQIPQPPGIRSFPVGEALVLNGMPMSIRAFSSEMSRDALLDWYREHLEQPRVETSYSRQHVLGKAYGDYYLTIQISGDGAHSNAVIALTDLRTARQAMSVDRVEQDEWLQRLPDGTQILSHMTSQDRGQRALHLAFRNDSSPQRNQDRLAAALQREGLAMERESKSPGTSRVLYFRGRGKEGMASISPTADGRTVVVLNTITRMETH